MVSPEAQKFLDVLDSLSDSLHQAKEDLRSRIEEWDKSCRQEDTAFALEEARLQKWFRDACTDRDPITRRVIEEPHRTRQNRAEAWNQIIKQWIKAELLPEDAWVHNYPRQRRPLVVYWKVLQESDFIDYLRLRSGFVQQVLAQGRAGVIDDSAWDIYYGAVFALIALGGVCWEGAFSSVVHIRAQHLRHLGELAIRVPQPHGNERTSETKSWVRVHLTPFVALCVASAACWRARPPSVEGVRKRPLASLHLGTDLLPDRRGESEVRSPPLPVAKIRRRFNRWLAKLCQLIGVSELTVRPLARLSRAFLLLADVYPEPVMSALLGFTPYNAVPFDELSVFDSYREPLTPPSWGQEGELTRGTAKRERAGADLRAEREGRMAAAGAYQQAIEHIQKAVCAYVHQRGSAEGAVTALSELVAEWLRASAVEVRGRDERSLAAALRRFYQRYAEDSAAWPREDIRRFNQSAVALALAEQIAQQEVKESTIAAYRTDLTTILSLYPGQVLCDLEDEALEDILALDLAGRTRQRTRNSLRRFRRFLGRTLDTSQPPISIPHWPSRGKTKTVHLLSTSQIEELLTSFVNSGTLMDRNGYTATLLMAGMGLRISEVVSLRLVDMVQRGDHYVDIRNTKGGKDRRVPMEERFAKIAEPLKDIWKQRDRESEDLLAPLIADEDGNPVSADSLSKFIIGRMEKLKLRGDPATGEPATNHGLRHQYVCRLLVKGVSPPLISRRVGHSGSAVTHKVYANCWDWMQRRCLQMFDDPHLPPDAHLSTQNVCTLLDLSDDGVRRAIERVNERLRPSKRIARVRASQVEGTVWGVRQGGGRPPKVVALGEVLRLLAYELPCVDTPSEIL